MASDIAIGDKNLLHIWLLAEVAFDEGFDSHRKANERRGSFADGGILRQNAEWCNGAIFPCAISPRPASRSNMSEFR